MREALASMTSVEPARTGAELVAFFRASPLIGEELMIKRDQSRAAASTSNNGILDRHKCD